MTGKNWKNKKGGKRRRQKKRKETEAIIKEGPRKVQGDLRAVPLIKYGT